MTDKKEKPPSKRQVYASKVKREIPEYLGRDMSTFSNRQCRFIGKTMGVKE